MVTTLMCHLNNSKVFMCITIYINQNPQIHNLTSTSMIFRQDYVIIYATDAVVIVLVLGVTTSGSPPFAIVLIPVPLDTEF